MREAMYYHKQDKGVRCGLCPKNCMIDEGMAGFCRVRKARGDKLYAENYGLYSSYALDPIEKKPLYHFYPGSYIFSLGTWGCNFSCTFCQNWQIAQQNPETREITPGQAVEAAADIANNIGLAYTYSEPGVWYEFVLETSQLAHERGLKNVLVTNGFINPVPLAELLPHLDALNIDVKAFNENFYRKICGGGFSDVKRTVEAAAKVCHVEITTLLIPGLNDSREEIAAMAAWLSGISPDIPLHFSRYFPNYKLDVPPTPLPTLQMALMEATKHMRYVYIGNVQGEGENTYCYHCGQLVIERLHGKSHVTQDKTCPACGSEIKIVGDIRF